MLQVLVWNNLSASQKMKFLQRPIQHQFDDLTQEVTNIIKTVQAQGDRALFAYTKKFDQVNLNKLMVEPAEFDEAMSQVSLKTIKAFERVIEQLGKFHQKQLCDNYVVETSPGVVCERVVLPIQSVGLYVPAGSAPLVSTVFMLGVPSQLGGCPRRILCVPPNRDGKIDSNVLVAAHLCGLNTVFKVGGAQAIAAMAYGTESIAKVDKIFGPGNSWVTTAKMLVSLDPRGAQLDMPAGPSEVLVIADDDANPAFVAADLLSQAEHGPDSQVFLICMSEKFGAEVNSLVQEYLSRLSRGEIACQAMKSSVCIVVDTVEEAVAISNEYAPEHLILQVNEPRQYLPGITAAGSVFLGPWSPESVGDYASGTNHVLPTSGFAKSYSGLSVRDFVRTMSVQELTHEGLSSLAKTIRVLTKIEGLDAHQMAIDIRV